MCESNDPNVTANEMCISWIKGLKAAWRPSAGRPMSPGKDAERPAAAPAAKPEPATAEQPSAPAPVAEEPAAEAAAPAAAGEEEEEEESFGF